MPKKNKTLCVDDLRHAEYYGMQPVLMNSIIEVWREKILPTLWI